MAAHYTAMDDPVVSFIGLPPSVNMSTPSIELVPRGNCNLEEYEIITPTGIPLRIFVQPSKSKSSIVTYHDIGTNYSSFLGFFGCPEMRVICKHFTVYHVCAPGHYEGAQNITQGPSDQEETPLKPNESTAGDRSGSISNMFTVLGRQSAYQNRATAYPTMDELAEMLTSVVDYFKLEYFVGFGMGAGSNVLARFALHHPEKLLALFLLNPNGTTHTYYEWFRNRWSDIPNLQHGVYTDNILNQLDAHWFGFGLANNSDLVEYYNQLMRSLNPVNVAGYLDAYINRTDLGLIRSLELPSIVEQRAKEKVLPSVPTAITVDTCLVSGSLATDLSRALADLNGRMDPRKTQFNLVPDCTGFLMEENPDKLSLNFLHFLRNVGLVVNMTPEKLHKEATALQVESAQKANEVVPSSTMIDDTSDTD